MATVGNHGGIVYPGIPNIDVENPSFVDHCPRSSPWFFHIYVRLRRANRIAELTKWSQMGMSMGFHICIYIYMIWIDMGIIILAMGTRNCPMNTRLYVHSNSYVHSSWWREPHFPAKTSAVRWPTLRWCGDLETRHGNVQGFGWGNGMVSSHWMEV